MEFWIALLLPLRWYRSHLVCLTGCCRPRNTARIDWLIITNIELLRGSQQKRHLVCQDANSAGMVFTCRTTPSIGGPRKCLMVEVVIDGNILIIVFQHLCCWEFEKSNLWSIPKTWAWQHSGRGWGELSFSAERTVSIRSGGPQRSRWLPSSQRKSRQLKKS